MTEFNEIINAIWKNCDKDFEIFTVELEDFISNEHNHLTRMIQSHINESVRTRNQIISHQQHIQRLQDEIRELQSLNPWR